MNKILLLALVLLGCSMPVEDVGESSQSVTGCNLVLNAVDYTDFTFNNSPLSRVKMKLLNNGTLACSYKANFYGRYLEYPIWWSEETTPTATATLPAGHTTTWITQYIGIETNGPGAEDCYYRPQAKFNGVWSQLEGEFACE